MAAAARILRRSAHFHTSPVVVPSTAALQSAGFEPYGSLSLDVDPNYYKRYRDPTAHDECPSVERRKRAQTSIPREKIQALRKEWGAAEEKGREAVEASWQGTGVDASPQTAYQGPDPAPKRPMAALFSGTGSQYLLMGSFLLSSDQYTSARETWEEAEEALSRFEAWRKNLDLPSHPELQKLDLDNWPAWQTERSADQLRQIVFGDSQQRLTKSSNAQPAILITAIALLRTLEKEFNTPITDMASCFAGHSSGEFAALVASGAISFAEGVWLTRLHGLLTSRTLMTSNLQSYMAEDAPAAERAQMSALMINPNITHEEFAMEVKQIRRAHRNSPLGTIEIASFNSSAQIVLAGTRAAIHHTAHLLHEKGMAYHAADIPCWTAFHTRSQIPAEAGMRVALAHPSIQVKAPSKPVISCLHGEVLSTPDEIKSALVSQISRPVRWTQALDTLRSKMGVRDFVFVGGKALANLAKREIERGHWGEVPQEPEGKQGEWGIHCASTETDLKGIRAKFGSAGLERQARFQ